MIGSCVLALIIQSFSSFLVPVLAFRLFQTVSPTYVRLSRTAPTLDWLQCGLRGPGTLRSFRIWQMRLAPCDSSTANRKISRTVSTSLVGPRTSLVCARPPASATRAAR